MSTLLLEWPILHSIMHLIDAGTSAKDKENNDCCIFMDRFIAVLRGMAIVLAKEEEV